MTTIIIRKNKDGVITGRCDSRCYGAKGKKCHCVCGGANHGVGKNTAIILASIDSEISQWVDDLDIIEVKQGQLDLF